MKLNKHFGLYLISVFPSLPKMPFRNVTREKVKKTQLKLIPLPNHSQAQNTR